MWYIPPYHTTRKLLERWAAWRVNTAERISKQSFQAESTYIFLRIFFSRKIAVYYKILSEATTRKFRKILGNVTSWRSAMILKKRPRLRAFFYDFVKHFHNSNSLGRLLLIFGDNKEFIDWNCIIYYKYYININVLSSARQLSLLPCLSKSSESELILSWYKK